MTDNTTPVKEIKIPVADPNDPYAIPAAMPSSVDHAVRSFNAGDYPEPSRKQDEWRYTPIKRINEFFTVFKPSGETQIEVSMIDGSPLAEGVKLSQIKLGEGLSGTVSSPMTASPQSNGNPATPQPFWNCPVRSPSPCSSRCTARGRTSTLSIW